MSGAEKINFTQDDFWEGLYRTNNTPWSLGKPAPPFKTFFNSPYALKPGKIAVLGCGHGYECELLISKGFEVTGIDFASSAIESTSQKFSQLGVLGTKGFLLEKNIFDLHEYDGYYDYVLEHCTFCAIDPSQRRSYVWIVRDLLKSCGKFIALWWLLPNRLTGPPFAVNQSEIFQLFDSEFNIDIAYFPQDSVKERFGQELLTVMTKLE